MVWAARAGVERGTGLGQTCWEKGVDIGKSMTEPISSKDDSDRDRISSREN